MKPTDHPEKKETPAQRRHSKETALLGGDSRLGDSRDGGTSGKAARPGPTSPMLSLLTHNSQLCANPQVGKDLNALAKRKPARRVNGDTQRSGGGAPHDTWQHGHVPARDSQTDSMAK